MFFQNVVMFIQNVSPPVYQGWIHGADGGGVGG